MQTRHLVSLLSLTWALLPVAVYAETVAESTAKGLPFLFTVGSDGACSHSNLQAALNAAQAAGPENDVIRIATNHTDTSVSAEIFAHSVTLEGGYTSCSASTSSGLSTLDGSGGSAASVLFIYGGSDLDQHVVILRDLTIRGGEDDGFGGGLDISGGMNVRLEGTIVEDNVSDFGGGISIRGSSASLVVAESSQILNNTASQRGGGVYCEGGFAGLFDSAIAFNEADTGGGVAAVQGCLFRHQAGGPLLGIYLNSAQSQGGGIYTRDGANVELTGTSAAPAAVVSNSASSSGGGLWVAGSEVRARSARIDSNSAGFGGGVGVGIGGRFFMELSGGSCDTSDRCSTLSGNTADRGGALSVNSSTGLADIRQTYVEGNSATVEGSAAYVTVGARLVMEGVVLAGNQGGESVIKLRGDTTSGLLAFVTMTDNDASDAVIVARDSTFGHAERLEIYSSILWEPAAAGILLSFDASTQTEVDCLLVNSNIGLPAGDFITVLPPVFADAGAGDYHLTESSPAVDYCDAAAYLPTHRDIDGSQRGVDNPQVPDNFLISWYDIGADELTSPDLIFSDGFESGNTSAWSSTSP